MKLKYLILSIFVFLTCPLMAKITPEQLRCRMVIDLDHIKHVFDVKYAPAKWKNEVMGWNLELEYEKAKKAILSMEEPTVKEFQLIMKRFFNAAKDYHVGIYFYSTEKATLPLSIRSSEGRYFVVNLDKSYTRVLRVGDEVIAIDGKPMNEVIEKIKKEELGENKEETDQAIAEILLTHRDGALGHRVPKGETILTIKHKKTKNQETVHLDWDYDKEDVVDIASGDGNKVSSSPLKKSISLFRNWIGCKPSKNQSPFLDKKMVLSGWPSFCLKEDPFTMGGRKGFLPLLGRKVWESSTSSEFYAYIAELGEDRFPNPTKIGYIRLPHFMGEVDECNDFKEIITLFEEETDALVIDQTNNPGGSIFYLYGLLSMLSEEAMTVPKHHILLTQEEVYLAATLLDSLKDIDSEEEAEEALGEEIGGYPVSLALAKKIVTYAQFVLSEWEAGHLYTEETSLFGIDAVDPSLDCNYTKPIVLLVNELDFSAADFFAAILQDNKRATLFGRETAGAGGYVIATQFPNQTGINAFNFTGSFAMRKEKMPIENLGVSPDVDYQISIRDIRENFTDYKEKLLVTIKELIQQEK